MLSGGTYPAVSESWTPRKLVATVCGNKGRGAGLPGWEEAGAGHCDTEGDRGLDGRGAPGRNRG